MGTRPAHELCFYFGGEGALAVRGEEFVCDFCVDTFGVDEEAVHVEETGADFGRGGGSHCCGMEGVKRGKQMILLIVDVDRFRDRHRWVSYQSDMY